MNPAANPESLTATSGGVGFNPVAQSVSRPLNLNGTCALGATFTRIADDCLGDRCAKLAPDVNEQLAAMPKVTRQFVLRLRGAVPGPYRILVRGICFDACFHGDEEDCFVFNVCKD